MVKNAGPADLLMLYPLLLLTLDKTTSMCHFPNLQNG